LFILASFDVDDELYENATSTGQMNCVSLSKEQLLQSLRAGRSLPQAAWYWQPAYDPTNYSRWQYSDSPYTVAYHQWYEPYLIVHRGAPRFFEPLIYTAMNKAAHAFQLSLSPEYQWIVLPNVFLLQRWDHNRVQFNKYKKQFANESLCLWNHIFLPEMMRQFSLTPDVISKAWQYPPEPTRQH